jgi:hypothetical protein
MPTALRRLRDPVTGVGEATREDAGSHAYGRHVLLLLSLALALDYADRSAVGALGPDIKHAFSIGNTRFGVVASAYVDAVRLDVVHPQLRGRAEGVRTVLQIAAEAAAPIAFGYLSDTLRGGGSSGMQLTFFIGLGTLVVSSLVLLLARRTYPREAAAVAASD